MEAPSVCYLRLPRSLAAGTQEPLTDEPGLPDFGCRLDLVGPIRLRDADGKLVALCLPPRQFGTLARGVLGLAKARGLIRG